MRAAPAGTAGWVVVVFLLAAGCSGEDSSAQQRPGRLGGPTFSPAAVPDTAMDAMEEPVAERLSPRLGAMGLTLQHVQCPRWDGDLPSSMQCKGYVDGVVADVRVRLEQGADARVEFDAEVDGGLVATSELVDRLEDQGYVAVDCGDRPAYPARVGSELVCRVHRGDSASYVVATVTDRRGAVEITEY